MDDHFLTQNKLLEDKLNSLIHVIETRLDKLFDRNDDDHDDANERLENQRNNTSTSSSQNVNPFSAHSFMTFRAPYIRDFREFSAPVSVDTKQIQQLAGNENIDLLIENRYWSKEAKQKLNEAVQEHYAQKYLVKLLKQKDQLLEQATLTANNEDILQKVPLLDEQAEQVRARKEPRIFVPQDRYDTDIDWCAISARLASSQHDAQDCRLMWSNELHWSINTDSMWTKDEDICLINAVAKHGKNDWDLVARELNSNRLAWQCCARYNQHYAFGVSSMDQSDSDKIIEVINLCRVGNFVPWNQVMYFIQSHTLAQVKYQWHKYCSEAKKSSPWTHNEDNLLMAAVKKFGEKNWSRVADLIPGRDNRSCRERYTMRLKYGKRVLGCWRPHEDERLFRLIELYGTNWSIVSAHLPERNQHQLRCRYELLKDKFGRKNRCPIKRQKLYRNSSCELVRVGRRRQKTAQELEVDQKLYDIFSTYRNVNIKRNSNKSIVCRSAQDELIYQTLVLVLCDTLSSDNGDSAGVRVGQPLLRTLIKKALCIEQGLLPPSAGTLMGYKAWTLQQDNLANRLRRPGQEEDNSSDAACDDNNDDGDDDDDEDEDGPEIDDKILKIFVSLFLWPAVLSRLKCPQVNTDECQVGSLIDKEAKTLYKIRNIQKLITK